MSDKKENDADAIRRVMFTELLDSLGIEKMIHDYLNQTATLQGNELGTVTFTEKFVRDLLDEVVIPIFAKYFTTEEIQELNLFYRTPLGMKMVNLLPKINIELAQGAMEWVKDHFTFPDDD